MKKAVIVFMVVLAIAIVAASMRQSGRNSTGSSTQKSASQLDKQPPQQASATQKPRVPAHYEDGKSAKPLAPTLDPAQFFGQARVAYQIAKEIPETLAQLPCYCYCDEGHGHKSLHTCYETDHSSMCAVCVNEALLAYKLQKEDGLTPAQIRERIIEQYSAMYSQGAPAHH